MEFQILLHDAIPLPVFPVSVHGDTTPSHPNSIWPLGWFLFLFVFFLSLSTYDYLGTQFTNVEHEAQRSQNPLPRFLQWEGVGRVATQVDLSVLGTHALPFFSKLSSMKAVTLLWLSLESSAMQGLQKGLISQLSPFFWALGKQANLSEPQLLCTIGIIPPISGML